jgi:alpha-1,3-fucosyltransferase
MPPKSYIDANVFATVEDLAEHLKFLDANPDEYVKYFWWRKHYKIREQYIVRGPQLCRICQKLNEPNIFYRNEVYTDIKTWYGKGICRKPNIKF